MSAAEDSAPPEPGASARCRYAWCTTEHGRTSHPDDEAHRSVGIATPLLIRRTAEPATERWTRVEIGLYRRVSDEQTWLTVDDGGEIGYDVSLLSLRAALLALADDPESLNAIRRDR